MIELEHKGNLLKISGRIDSITSPEIERKLNELLGTGIRTVLIDLSSVNYISSAGLRVFLTIQKQLVKAAGEIIFIGVGKNIYEIFDLGGFSQLFKFFDSLELFNNSSSLGNNAEEIVEIGNIKFVIKKITEQKHDSLTTFGDSGKVQKSEYTEDDMTTIKQEKIKYGTGLASFGENFNEIKDYFGESLILNNSLYFYPAIKNSAVDYILYGENAKNHNYQFLHGFGFNGKFNEIISFEGKDQFVKIPELIDGLFKSINSDVAGVVLIAESKGFWGMNLKKVPISDNAPIDSSSIFENKNIFDWLNYPVEPSEIDNIILGVGVVRKNNTVSSIKCESIFSKESTFHLHAAICEKGIISNDVNHFEEEINRVISDFKIEKIQHILPNTQFSRGIIGIVELEDK